MSRTRAETQPFWATAIDRMDAGCARIVRGLHVLIQRSPALADHLWFGSGWRTNSKEHASGRAIDIIVTANTGRRPTAAEHAAAMTLIDWLIDNAKALKIQWILFSTDGKDRTQSWNADRGTWNNLANRGGISANHVDHIHVLFKPGADWPARFSTVTLGKATTSPGLPSTGDTKPAPKRTVTQYRVSTNGARLNGRKGPGTKHAISITAGNGVVLDIVETKDGWAKSTGGHWYSMAYLTKLDAKPSKTIEQMAREVIAGKHGNGHSNRQKSLGVTAAVYAQVRARVNQLI